MVFQPDEIVKSCRRLESGLRLGPDGIRACCLGPIVSPAYWTSEELNGREISKTMIMEKRRQLFEALNDDRSEISCKDCMSVIKKPYKDVRFDRIGHVNLSHYSMCNLRCYFCGYALHNDFVPPQYDALAVLEQFSGDDVEWDAYVDLNGGEPTLLKDLEKYMAYFQDRRIRILLYSNAVLYRQSIYDALANGGIQWLIVSLDAGTASTFKQLKGRDSYRQVIENLTRYAQAGSRGGGQLAVKYVFCKPNCGDDDINGFVYTMLAIRPQKIWLTVDFLPLCDTYEDQEAVGVYDYSRHIDAYARMYLAFKQHGLDAVHFSDRHLSGVLHEGKSIFARIKDRIGELTPSFCSDDVSLYLQDFRKPIKAPLPKLPRFGLEPLMLKKDADVEEAWSLANKRVLITPVWRHAEVLAKHAELNAGCVLGFLDRSPALEGRQIHGLEVYGYDALTKLTPDVVLVDSPEQHREDIVRAVSDRLGDSVSIALLDHCDG